MLPSHLPLMTINYSRKSGFTRNVKTHHIQHRRQREGQENLQREGITGPLTSVTMEVNFASLKLTWLLSCGVQLASSIRLHARCSVGGNGGGEGWREGKTGISRSNIMLRQNSYFATVVGKKVTKTVSTNSTVYNNSDSAVQGHDGKVLHAVCV